MTAALMYFVGNVLYLLLGSGEEQPFNRFFIDGQGEQDKEQEIIHTILTIFFLYSLEHRNLIEEVPINEDDEDSGGEEGLNDL